MSTAPARRARIVYFVNSAGFFLSHRLPLALAAARSGYEVHVCCGVEQALHAEVIRNHGLNLHAVVPTRGRINPLLDLRLFFQWLRVVRNVRPQVIHCVTAKQVIFGNIVGRCCGVPRILGALTGLGYALTREPRSQQPVAWRVRFRIARRALLRFTAGFALRLGLGGSRTVLILQNQTDLEALVTSGVVERRRCFLIPGSGVDMQVFVPAPEADGVPLVVLPARMLRDKGVNEFCEAASTLRARGVAVTFALVGGIDRRNPSALSAEEVRSTCSATGAEWWGEMDDMCAVLHKSTVVCLPSYREGLPKALIEAGACARAIVATDVAGCRDVVQHGVTGLLVPPGNAEAIARSVLQLLDSPALRQRLGNAARQQALARFSLEDIIRQTLNLYEPTNAGAGSSAPRRAD